ncbi:MAG: alpha/beta hydrolase [Sphingomonas sp.]
MTRVTGWRRAWRWAKRILLGLLALLILVVIVGAIYEALGRRAAARDFPPPGKRVDIGGRSIHIDCRGTGSPTVVFEAGLGSGGSVEWSLVHDQVARVTRACAYDRAGIMWSDAKDGPQDAVAVADDLHATLKAAGITDPLVLVGHSIGGPYIRTYAGRYGDQVAGLVFVDSSHADQVVELGKVTRTNMHPGKVSALVDTASALSWTGLVRFLAAGTGSPLLSARDRERMAAYASSSIRGARAELAGFDRTMDAARAVRTLGDRPLVVLTAMKPPTAAELKALGLTPEEGARFKQRWATLNGEIAALSTRSRQQLVPDAGHYIQYDRPDTVIAAVRDVVGQVRAGTMAAR